MNCQGIVVDHSQCHADAPMEGKFAVAPAVEFVALLHALPLATLPCYSNYFLMPRNEQHKTTY